MLAMSAGERAALGQRARERVLANYTIERFAGHVWGLYRSLVRL
jgi:hypothetical protein